MEERVLQMLNYKSIDELGDDFAKLLGEPPKLTKEEIKHYKVFVRWHKENPVCMMKF